MKTGLTISVIGHAAALLWAVVSFGAKPPAVPPPDSLPIDIISATEFSELMAGSKAAPKAPAPKPLVEKIAEPKPVDNPAQKVVEKPEIVTASALMPEAPPEPKVPEPKPAPVPQARPEPKPQEAEKKPEPKPDPIAEALKKDSKKPEPKKEEAKIPAPQKKPPQPQPKFDPRQIEQRLALLDKRTPQRQAAAGETLNTTAALGTATGTSLQLSQSEIDAFRQKLKACWHPPVGAPSAEKINVPMTIRLKLDRTLAGAPEVEMSARDAYTRAMIESAVRAVIECQPYTMFSPARYETWKEIPLNFDPLTMFGG
jgi:hypothetical protein